MDRLREFLKENKGNIILLGVAVLLYSMLFSVFAYANEPMEASTALPLEENTEAIEAILQKLSTEIQPIHEAIREGTENIQILLLWLLTVSTLSVVFLLILIIAVIWRA